MTEQKSIGINLASGSDIHLSDVGVNGADIGLRGRHFKNLRVDNFRYQGDGQAFDLVGDGASIMGSRLSTPVTVGKSHVGYTKPNGPPLPAQCPNCHSIFPSRHYNVAVPRFLVKNSTETCRVCGYEEAVLADGVFDLMKDFVKVIEAEKLTVDMLRAIGALARDYVESREGLEPTIGEVAKISPATAALLRNPRVIIIGVWAWLAMSIMQSFNVAHDFAENSNADGVASMIFSHMAEVIVTAIEGVEEADQTVDDSDKRSADRHSDEAQQDDHDADNGGAVPSKVPIPLPMPKRPPVKGS